MPATASRLGSTPLLIDWSGMAAVATGQIDSNSIATAWRGLKSRVTSGEVGFYNAPVDADLSQAAQAHKLAEQILARGNVTDCLFLGIGGSALGPLTVLSALAHKRRSKVKFHFIENPDPVDWRLRTAELRPESTLVCIVTKSGTTFETLAQSLLALEWLGRARWKSHVVAITDPTKGDLRKLIVAEGIPSLAVAPSIGGRFSVFTPVGLFAIALAGLSAEEFLSGAAQSREFFEKTSGESVLEKNPLFIVAHHLLAASKKHPIHVCMPYSTALRQVGLWWVQLWGESLGKDGKGFTPLAAVGATDQHSLLQLLRDGPDDKVTLFVTVSEVPDAVTIPKLDSSARGDLPAFTMLEGHSLQELLTTEYRAISRVLTNRRRPHLTLQLDRLDERALGSLMFSLCVLTALTGTLMGVDPFDQPGVEEGKVYIREMLA